MPEIKHTGIHVRLPFWIRWWMFLAFFVVSWDTGYVLLMPHSLEGGVLFPIWQPYKLYGTIDLVYSAQKWKDGDGFCRAQSVCNVMELIVHCTALRLAQSNSRNDQTMAVLLALLGQTMTFWKTMLYWLYDIAGNLQSTGHNPLSQWILLYMIPNGLWLVVPLLCIINLAGQVLAALWNAADRRVDMKEE